MDAATIQAQIRRYEQRNASLEQDNAKLKDMIERLNQADGGYQQKQQSYYDYVCDERAQADRARAVSQIRIAEGYAESMLGLSTGNSSLLAGDAFGSILSQIRGSRQRMEDLMRNNSNTIGNLRLEISRLRNSLYSLA